MQKIWKVIHFRFELVSKGGLPGKGRKERTHGKEGREKKGSCSKETRKRFARKKEVHS